MANRRLPDVGFFEKHRAKIAFAGPDECWLWTAGADRKGYGKVGVNRKTHLAHRQAYEAIHGAGTAEGMVVRHRCDNPPCVNPAHLEVGTHADNIRDRDERGRNRQPKGSANGLAKLTEADVLAIRAECVTGSRTHGQQAISERFGVSNQLISNIILRKIWTHI